MREVARMLLNLHKPVSDYLALNLCPKWADSAFYGPLLVVLTQEGYEGFESWYKIIMGVAEWYLFQTTRICCFSGKYPDEIENLSG